MTGFSWYQSEVYSKENLDLTGNLKQVIVTLQYTYTILTMILTPFGIDHSFFWDPSLESFDIPDFNSSFKVILIPF